MSATAGQAERHVHWEGGPPPSSPVSLYSGSFHDANHPEILRCQTKPKVMESSSPVARLARGVSYAYRRVSLPPKDLTDD